ncbi:hypothetical protein M231_00562 [Tremella mesenterica]|uniref:RRM domain-containing protein n=1 Tax=Tremella mesenterica TaxID=5217 RepID=A0A4Q1BVN0_TREME|nr:hypothetical protein M231_00562 [Tremella mesenterica]
MNRTVLYVSGFSSHLRAKDLAYEFERYGRLIRCDIPALKTPSATPFAFVEFRRDVDAEEAYYDMHGRSIDGRRITVQWAKKPPSSAWRHDGAPDRRDREYDRRRSPPPPPRRRSPSPRRDDRYRDDRRDRDREVEKRRSLSPRREDKADKDVKPDVEPTVDKVRSPSPKPTNGNGNEGHVEDKEDDRERRDD